MDRLVCLGLSHRTAPVELRERLTTLGPQAGSCPAVVEHAVLSTCYRVELYAYLEDGVEEAREELIGVLAEGHDVERGAPRRPPLRARRRGRRASSRPGRRRSRLARARRGRDPRAGRRRVRGEPDGRHCRPCARAALPDGRRGRPASAERDRDRREPCDGELDGAGARRGRARRSPLEARARRRAPGGSGSRRSRPRTAAASRRRPSRTGRRSARSRRRRRSTP